MLVADNDSKLGPHVWDSLMSLVIWDGTMMVALYTTSVWRSSYLLLHCRRGWNELLSASPLCSCPSRCVSTGTRASRGWGRSPLGREPRRWLALAGWRRGTAASPRIPLRRQQQTRVIDGWSPLSLKQVSDWLTGIMNFDLRLLIHVYQSQNGPARQLAASLKIFRYIKNQIWL